MDAALRYYGIPMATLEAHRHLHRNVHNPGTSSSSPISSFTGLGCMVSEVSTLLARESPLCPNPAARPRSDGHYISGLHVYDPLVIRSPPNSTRDSPPSPPDRPVVTLVIAQEPGLTLRWL